MAKIIIGIHGLGNKPPAKIIRKWWIDSICEGFQRFGSLKSFFKFELVYWAQYIHPVPLNPAIQDPDDPLFLDEHYAPFNPDMPPRKMSNRKKFLDYLEKQMDKLLLNEDLTINFGAISDLIIHHFFNDLEIYYSAQSTKPDSNLAVCTAIQDELKNTLIKYKNHDILLLAHSMGTIIAYEVLQELKDKVAIHTLMTFGSPLGIPVIKSKIFARLKVNQPDLKKISVPENIKERWINFSDLEDKVAINYNLADDIHANSRNIAIEDIEVHNDYVYRGNPNPHKIYGYLRTPEAARAISEFLESDRNKLQLWFDNTVHRIYRIIKNSKSKFSRQVKPLARWRIFNLLV